MARCFSVLILAALAALPMFSVQAKPPASKSMAALLLARTCVKEAGWEVTDDCAAIHIVLQKRADIGGIRFEHIVDQYSRPSVGRPWLHQLDAAGAKPANWPAGMPWGGIYRAKWLAVLDHATAIVGGGVQAACDPDHWGDHREDHKRAVRNGWSLIECGTTKNEFWQVGVDRD